MIDAVVGTKGWGKPWILWFGAHAATEILVYADSLDDALEDAAQEIHERGWLGLFTEPDYEDAYEDMKRDGEIPDDVLSAMEGMSSEEAWDIIARDEEFEDIRYRIMEYAETDLTYTESGYIAAWEWGISAEDPSREDILRIAHSDCHWPGMRFSDGSVWTRPDRRHQHGKIRQEV